MLQFYTNGKQTNFKDLGGGIQRKVLSQGDKIMTVEVSFEEGAVGALHQHLHEQATYILMGSFEFTIDDKTFICQMGDTLFIPSNSLHGCRCLETGTLLDIFTPIREDFLL